MYLGIDIGGTSIKFGVIDDNFKIIYYTTCKTPDNSINRIVDVVYDVAKKIKETYDFKFIGISSAGVIDNKNMKVVSASATIKDYAGTDFKKDLGDKLGVYVYADNDVNCALLGEQWLGSAKNLDEVFCIALGTGIGGAYYLDKLPEGSSFSVGEIGQAFFDRKTNTTFEDRASTIALDKKIKEKLDENLEVKEFFELCKNNDKNALNILNEWITDLASGLVSLILILDPKHIIIGGAVSHQGNYLLNKIVEKVKELNPIKINNTNFYTATLGNDAAIFGAISPFVEK